MRLVETTVRAAPPKAQGAGLAQAAPAELTGLAGKAGAETTPRPRPAFLMRMFRPFPPSALPPVPPPASLGLSTWLPALHQWADTCSSAQVPVESKRSQQVHLTPGLRWSIFTPGDGPGDAGCTLQPELVHSIATPVPAPQQLPRAHPRRAAAAAGKAKPHGDFVRGT